MNKNNFFLCILFLSSQLVFSQASVNMSLRQKINSEKISRSSLTDVLIKGEVNEISAFITSQNGKVIGTSGKIVSARISIGTVAQLIEKPFVKIIQGNIHKIQTMNDTMRMLTRVDEVHNGQTPLPQSYDGTGVLIRLSPMAMDRNGRMQTSWEDWQVLIRAKINMDTELM